ncbi:MAG: hypothetical protein ACR2PG_14185 [Hyphomicrobiaceae bacterium]
MASIRVFKVTALDEALLEVVLQEATVSSAATIAERRRFLHWSLP